MDVREGGSGRGLGETGDADGPLWCPLQELL